MYKPEFILPRHLSDDSRKWAQSIIDRYEIQEQHFRILILAGEALDRGESARKVIAKKGATYTDRFGAPRNRPEVAIERDSRIAFVRCMRELNLEVEAQQEPRRHPRVAPRISK
jgi:hypothetical protein